MKRSGNIDASMVLDVLHEYHVEDIDTVNHPSMLSNGDGYDVLLFRVPLTRQADAPHTFAFVIVDSRVFRYDRDEHAAVEISGGFSGLHGFLDRATDFIMERISDNQERIIGLEEDVFENVSARDFNREWQEMRKQLLVHERIAIRSGAVIRHLISEFGESDPFPETEFRDLAEHIQRNERAVSLMLRKLDDLYNMYATFNNERINNTVYLLTIISAIFLPLNLVVGFFGMNTGGLPFATTPAGTAMVVGIMVLIVVMILGIFLLNRRRHGPPEDD